MKSLKLGDLRNLTESKNLEIQKVRDDFFRLVQLTHKITTPEFAEEYFSSQEFRGILKDIRRGSLNILKDVSPVLKDRQQELKFDYLRAHLDKLDKIKQVIPLSHITLYLLKYQGKYGELNEMEIQHLSVNILRSNGRNRGGFVEVIQECLKNNIIIPHPILNAMMRLISLDLRESVEFIKNHKEEGEYILAPERLDILIAGIIKQLDTSYLGIVRKLITMEDSILFTEQIADLESAIQKVPTEDELLAFKDDYKAYSTDYDETVKAEDFVEVNELERLHAHLEDVSSLGSQDELSQLQLSIKEWGIQFQKATQEKLGYVPKITFLVDNSGSMRGRPIFFAVSLLNTVSKGLIDSGIRDFEILGNTTKHWSGGEANKKWVEEDRPQAPGRLSDLRHIIYKSGDGQEEDGMRNLGLMLKEGLLKENIDGEALEFAISRRNNENEKQIIVHISDGAPICDATISANGDDYLSQHLAAITVDAKRKNIDMHFVGINNPRTPNSMYASEIVLNPWDSPKIIHTDIMRSLSNISDNI